MASDHVCQTSQSLRSTSRKRKAKQEITTADSDPGRQNRVKRHSRDDNSERSGGASTLLESAEQPIFDLPPADINDRFYIDPECIGSGQFGTVRCGTDRLTGARMAVKSLRKERLSAPEQREEVRREVEVMMRLAGHDGIVQLRGVYEDARSVHLVMDLCAGGELFEEVLRRQRFSEGDAAALFAQVVSAVAFCHARGVVHRDLKPENILLARPGPNAADASSSSTSTTCGCSACLGSSHGGTTNSGVNIGISNASNSSGSLTAEPLSVKLADFGLAALIQPGAERAVIRGTTGSPLYMAPEVLSGEYDEKADVWSLGVILYILLSGSPPFWGDSDAEVFARVLRGEIDFSFAPWDTVSLDAKLLVQWLLTSDPSHRPSAEMVLSHPWLMSGGRTSPSSPPSPPSPASVPTPQALRTSQVVVA